MNVQPSRFDRVWKSALQKLVERRIVYEFDLMPDIRGFMDVDWM